MRYHPRIQTAALKVGFHALLLHKYSKRLQTYSSFSRLLVSLCANKNKRTGKGVGTDFFPVHVTFSNYDLLTRGSNQFI